MDFKDKLKKLSERKKADSIDWGKNKVEWLEQVDKLYNTIEDWFCEHLDEGLMILNTQKIELSEEYIGLYEIDKIELGLGEGTSSNSVDEVIVFEPIGRNIIGAKGRIDLYLKGRKSEKVLLLLMSGDNKNLHWELWKSRNKKDRMKFTRKKFEMLISEWLNL